MEYLFQADKDDSIATDHGHESDDHHCAEGVRKEWTHRGPVVHRTPSNGKMVTFMFEIVF